MDMSDAPQSMSELALNPHSLNDRKAYVERCIRAGFTRQRSASQARHEFNLHDCVSKLMLGWWKATGERGKPRKRRGKKQKQDEANVAANAVDIAPL